jgi:hypothetical protein
MLVQDVHQWSLLKTGQEELITNFLIGNVIPNFAKENIKTQNNKSIIDFRVVSVDSFADAAITVEKEYQTTKDAQNLNVTEVSVSCCREGISDN